MVEIDKKFLLNGLINPHYIKKNNHKYFLKLSKKYPYFIAPHIINILISKKYNTVNYKRSLKALSLNFVDREHIYNILNNQKKFDDQDIKEVVKDIKKLESNKKQSFVAWVLKTESTQNDNNSTFLGLEKKFINNLKFKTRNIESPINEEDFMTETLAKIYLKQNKFKKALKAYKILSLKYPEKISLFATQIKFIKNKLNNE